MSIETLINELHEFASCYVDFFPNNRSYSTMDFIGDTQLPPQLNDNLGVLISRLLKSGTEERLREIHQRLIATPGIERVRAYVLTQFYEPLTVETAYRVHAELVRRRNMGVDEAKALTLDEAMDILDAAPTVGAAGGKEGEGGPLALVGDVPNTIPLPTMLSAADIAKRINRNPKSVNSFLRRYAKKNPDCCIENPTKRKNEPTFIHRINDVLPALEKWMKDGGGKLKND